MIFDQENLFSDRQSVAGSAGSGIPSTNIIDLGAPTFRRDVGLSQIPLRVQVVEDVTGSGSAMIVSVETSDDETFTNNVSVIAVSPAVSVQWLKAGYVFQDLHVPIGAVRRYLRLRYLVVNASTTGGRVTAGIVLGHDFSNYRVNA